VANKSVKEKTYSDWSKCLQLDLLVYAFVYEQDNSKIVCTRSR